MKLNRRKFCKCGCGQKVNYTWSPGHQFRGKAPHNKGVRKIVELHPCKCGCCELVTGNYVRGHGSRVVHWSRSPKAAEVKQKLSVSASKRTGELHPRYGKKHTESAKILMSKAKENYVPWNKGKTGYFSEQAIENISNGRRGKPAWNSGLKDCHPPEVIEKLVHRGPDNAWYIDGRAGQNPYPPGWRRKLKNLIKERDGYRCRLCCTPESELLHGLSVHHIDYDKDNLDESNLVSLCRNCHAKTNYNRSKWQSFFEGRKRLKRRAAA